MMRRARISVRPNVRPVGRGPSSSQDGQSILASTVNSLAAGETSQTIEMVSNVTDNEPSPEDSAIKFPEASEFTSTHDTLSEKALCNLGENGQTCVTFDDCIPADTSLKRRESVSDVCNIAQPRVIPKPLSAKALESSVSKSVTMASCSVAPVSVPEDQTVTEDEGLQSRGQQKLPVRGKRPRKAKNLGLSFAGVCVPSPEDLAVSMRKESESQPSTSAVVHETSSMSSYQERIIKSRMLKQLMKDELRKGRTKHKPHLEYINPLDHSKMTMRDLIYYLPDGNPMKSCMKDEQTGKENLRLLSNERKEIPQKEAEEEKDDCDEDLSQNDDELVVPKVKVAEDGSLILDEDSLTVKVSKTTGPAIVEENDPLFECGSTATYSSFRKIRHVKPWSIKETDMFFLAISMVGTDFSIIGRLFPHRPRKEIKNKFRKEERINAWRIDKAFREKRPYDEQFFSMLLGRILTTEKKKRNVNMRDSKAKKVNNQESKPKKKKMKTKIEVSVMENAQQDESHITIEEEESDCRVTEGNMEMTEKNEDSINVLKVGNKTLPNKKPGKRRNTEEVLDTSSAKPVDGKKRKMKTSVEIINCDKVGDAQTSSEEPESTMEHTASGDRSNGATGMLSPSSRRCCQNPTANIGKRVRKRIPGSPENREICSAEDESRVNSICVSTVENEAAILNREEVKKAGQIITPGEDFLEEPENMDCQLNRFEGHEDMFSSGSSVKHRPREACTLTSIPAKKSCQEKEYSASSSPDGVKVDTVNDESAIKYIQNVPTENGEKESSEQNGIQDEMARGTDIMDPSLEKRNQIPGLAQVAQIQRSSAVQSNDVSLTITNAAAKVSMPPVFEGRDDLENSFADNQKDKQFDNQILEHEEAWSGCLSHEDLFDSSSTIQHRPREACTLTSITAEKSCQEKEYSASSSPDGVKMDTVNDESAIKYIQNVPPENSEKDSSSQNWTLDGMSRGRDIMNPSLERRNQILSLAQVTQIQQSCAVQCNDVSPTITNAAAKVSLPPVFEGRDDLENSFTDNQKDKQFDNQNLGHEEACTRDSSDGKTSPKKTLIGSLGRRRCRQPKPNLSRVSRGLSVISAKSNEGMKEVKDATEEHLHDLNTVRCVENRSGCLSHEDLFDSSSTIQHRPREACTLTSITAEKSCQEKEYTSSSPDGVKMDTVHNESAIKYIQNVLPENTEKDSSGQNWTLDEMSSRAYHPLRSPSIREKIPEAVMEKDMQPVIAISSTVKAEVVTHLPPKGDSCGVITTVEMVTEAVTTDVTEQEPTFILTLVPVSEVPPPPESTEQQSEMLLPASQRYSTQYSTLERDFVSDQVLNTSSSSVTQKDTKDPEDYFAKHSSKRNVPEATKKEEATLNEEPEQLDILPSSPKTVQPISVKSSTEEAVTDSAKVEMSQDTVSLSDLSVKNKNKETAEDQSSPTFKSEEEILKSNPLITPLFLKALKFQNNNDDTETERKMPLDLPISSHSSASDINATYSPSSPTKVYSSISEPAQCEFLCANVKEIDEEPTNVSEYFLSDIFTEVKESESD
ncbi:transcription factor TFIIIB component B'' homolog isoform X5 [Brienomyrus brachyistius]|uniref:transcription factor TFIIIB component B'' homolog isoform X5 n=1 Tax=Brienomyrus brachyistius TaxID=42636 RepID=UPI0020B1B6BE|nr:transcription factor TFIIIB component B'' homolog isoform X5 [Brienomyrus brachyistius]